MTAISPVPRRLRTPSWLDPRLVVGVVLVLGSVLAGVAVVSSSGRTQRVWALTHDVGSGVVLTSDDVRAVAVRIPQGGTDYFGTSVDVTGQTVTREVGAGELLPRSALGPTSASTTVTIPLSADVAPKIKAGQRVTVWVSTKTCPSATVLNDTSVQDVQDAQGSGFGSGGGEDVVVRLSSADAQRVIQALALKGGTIRAGVLSGPSARVGDLQPLSACEDGDS
jgi:hypothetical protein